MSAQPILINPDSSPLSTNPRVHVNREAIMSYKNDLVVKRYANRFKVSEEYASRLFYAMKQMLWLSTVHEGVNPSKEVDDMWHWFILHTKQYIEFCGEFFGHYVHHSPADTADVDAYQATRHAVAERFGALDIEIWGEESGRAGHSSHGCGCNEIRPSDRNIAY